ncbi:G-protein coupled receptor [Ectocarpus siliculosus]|uniref:G-protein coupled receptor n=1 Tax=Ectocarpus siliculosus TaxID=2880 RepID=D7FGZ0_ECTSI|nr:G-protein coupled receptor [Ectocarpus siliculosus]|eukprot:CBJ28368.1 G-protein coupled receptor [Ectocarpus siliculosus]
MDYTKKMARASFFAACLVGAGQSFKYSLDDTVYEQARTSYSEGWMYGSNTGPMGATHGSSYIHTDLQVTAIPLREPSSGEFNISIMFYRSTVLDYGVYENLNICDERVSPPSAFTDVEVISFPAVRNADYGAEDGALGQAYTADVLAHREITESGLQHAFIQVCPTDVGAEVLNTAGSLDFRNPYGYLPGADYGCLPFEVFRVVASMALGIGFGYAMLAHRASILPVHKMIIGVIVLSTLEASTWWGAYSYVNATGRPYCCPYPGVVVLAMLMEVVRRTTSRFMLLMICLGYGITRVQLERREMISVCALTVAFFASGIVQLASSVGSASNVGSGGEYETYNPLLAVPALLFDMVFLTWIYGQLSNMLKELKDLNETYKYKMFRGLAWTLGTFVTLFTTLTVAMLAAEGSQTQSWEWKFEWINVVSWEILNFCMLAAVSIIWRPSPRSALLAYSKQLATTEVGAEEADGIEMDTVEFQGAPGGQFTIGDDGDDDGVEEEGDELGDREGKVDGQGGLGTVYSMANFEPQRHTDLA